MLLPKKIKLFVTKGNLVLIILLNFLTETPYDLLAANRLGYSISTRVDTSQTMIGGHITLMMEVIHPNSSKIEWPSIEKKLSSFEVLNKKISNTSLDTAWNKQSLKIVLTNFSAGNHLLPSLPIKVLLNQKIILLYSKEINITYNTPLVDLSQPFKDIHPSVKITYNFKELYSYIIVFSALVFIIIIFFSNTIIKNYHRIKSNIYGPRVYREVFKKLKKLEKAKDINTELAEVLRNYISERFSFNLDSKTSNEVIKQLKLSNIDEGLIDGIADVFDATDAAKYSKNKSHSTDAHILLKKSRDFVLATKPLT